MMNAKEAKRLAIENFAVSAEAEVEALYKREILPAINEGKFEIQVKKLSKPAQMVFEQNNYSVRLTHLGSRENPQSEYIISWN